MLGGAVKRLKLRPLRPALGLHASLLALRMLAALAACNAEAPHHNASHSSFSRDHGANGTAVGAEMHRSWDSMHRAAYMASALAGAVALALAAYLVAYGMPRRLGYSQFLELKMTPGRGSNWERKKDSDSGGGSVSGEGDGWRWSSPPHVTAPVVHRERSGGGLISLLRGGSGGSYGGGSYQGEDEQSAAGLLRESRGLPRTLDSSMLLDMEYGGCGGDGGGGDTALGT